MATVQQVVDSARDQFAIPRQLPDDLPVNMIDLLNSAFMESPDAPAFSALGTTLSYRQLNRLSDNFASYLQNHSCLQPGDRIAIQLPNLLQYPVVAFGALKAGLILVNTNPLYTPRELRTQLQDSGARALIVLDSLLHQSIRALPGSDVALIISTGVADLLGGVKGTLVKAAIKISGRGRKVPRQANEVTLRTVLKKGAASSFVPHSASSDDVALLQYTGGTTGVSKGAELTHRNLVSNTVQALSILCSHGMEPGKEVIIAPLPLYHVFAFVGSMVMMIYIRSHVHLIPDPRNLPSMVKVLKKTPFTIFFGLNTLFASLMRNEQFRKIDCSTLKLTVSGGMALTEAVANQWQQMTGCGITEGYGLTETSPVVSVNVPGQEVLGTVGVIVPGTQVSVIDSNGKPQPPQGAGELCVKGPQVMRGYWNKPEETANCLDAEGWLRTGDVVCVGDDGRLRILDRMKDMIIVSGFNVYPNEIENVLDGHPGIQESAAIGIDDPETGEAIKVFAVVTDPELTAEKLKAWCRKQLTGYKIPQQFEFCEELPKSNVGKVLRAQLRAQ